MHLYEIETVLITGATSGIGKALCFALAPYAKTFLLAGRSKEKLQQLSLSLKNLTSHPIYTYPSRLQIKEERKELLNAISYFKPNLVINNAGFGLYGAALDYSTEEQLEILKVNGEAVLEITLQSAHSLSCNHKKGIILNIGSVAGFFAYPTFSVYAASKAFVISFSQGLDAELKPLGIRVLCNCPGQVATGFRKRASKDFPQKKSFWTMNVDLAVRSIFKQIRFERGLYLFDWRYKIATTLIQALPKKMRNRILTLSIQKRYRAKNSIL